MKSANKRLIIIRDSFHCSQPHLRFSDCPSLGALRNLPNVARTLQTDINSDSSFTHY